MGRHKFRLSDMIPNAWFFKLRDMRAARGGASRARPPTPTPSTPHRASCYYTPRAGDHPPLVGVQRHPRASDTHFPPLPELSPPRRSRSAARRRQHRRRSVKLAAPPPASVMSSPVSTGCRRCRRKPELVAVEAPVTPPCRRDKFVGYNDDDDDSDSGEILTKKPTVAMLPDEDELQGKLITSATDIIIDLRTSKKTSPDTDNKLLLPPIVTKPARRRTPDDAFCDPEDKHVDTLAHGPVQEQSKAARPRRSVSSSSARRLKTRANTPRVSKKSPRPPAPATTTDTKPQPPLAESFAVVKTSRDPRRDFRESMEEMIAENGIRTAADLEDLLACYLSLNAAEYHDLIVDVFEHIWAGLADIKM